MLLQKERDDATQRKHLSRKDGQASHLEVQAFHCAPEKHQFNDCQTIEVRARSSAPPLGWMLVLEPRISDVDCCISY
jgi:hypothetical protein